MTDTSLPAGFEELEPFVPDWALARRDDRYAMRLSKHIDELGEFYDAIAARAEEAMDLLDSIGLDELPPDAVRLLRLLYSLIMVSDAVTIFRNPKIPDSGSAFYNQTVEPAI